MWWILAVLLIIVGIAYFAPMLKNTTTTTTTAVDNNPVPEQPQAYVPKPNEDNYYKQQAAPPTPPTPAAPAAPAASPEPSSPKTPEPDRGVFEIVAKGDTGAEKIIVTIDGMKYGTYALSKSVERIRVDTPRRVDLANVVIKDVSPTRDENGADTNIRVAAIYVNGSNENMRTRLYQAGRDPSYIRNGLLFWGGEYTFHSQDGENKQLDPSAQSNTTLPSVTGTIEITAKGDVGNEQFRVVVDGLTYPAPAGTLNEDGTIATGTYVTPVENTKFVIKTPRRVEISNVTIKFINDATDPTTNKDRNIRIQSITINGESQDQRPRLFRTGLDEARLNNLRTNGGLFWGGDYTFV